MHRVGQDAGCEIAYAATEPFVSNAIVGRSRQRLHTVLHPIQIVPNPCINRHLGWLISTIELIAEVWKASERLAIFAPGRTKSQARVNTLDSDHSLNNSVSRVEQRPQRLKHIA
jgi:hypothetical protein